MHYPAVCEDVWVSGLPRGGCYEVSQSPKHCKTLSGKTTIHYYISKDDYLKYLEIFLLLAPTGALVLMMVYCIYIRAAATFSDFEHLCLSILLQVSL